MIGRPLEVVVLLLLAMACADPDPCAGAPVVHPDLTTWAEVPVGDGVVCRVEPAMLVVDYPGQRTEDQLTGWATALEGAGWQVVELAEPDKGITDSRWSRGEAQLSLTVQYQRTTRSTTVYASRY